MLHNEYKHLMFDKHEYARQPNKEQSYRHTSRTKASLELMIRKAEQVNRKAVVQVRWA